MADISKIKLPNTNVYNLKDDSNSHSSHTHYLSEIGQPLMTKTYEDVIGTSNDNVGGGFFYLKIRGTTYNTKWYVKTRVIATIPGQELYQTDTIFSLWGHANTYSGYICVNKIKNTSYRPIYYNSYFRVSSSGYDNGCGGWAGFNLYNSHNPIDTSYKRNITVQVLDYADCEIELQDELITPTNIPSRAANTGWYSSTLTSFDNFDACTQGIKHPADANSTSISNLYWANGHYIADSVVYRYQLLFQAGENILTPLNNNNNVPGTTKTMLTNVEFNPFGKIFYYASTTTVNAEANISGAALFFNFGGVDLRYSFNTGSTLVANQYVYLVVVPTSNNKVKIANTLPITQELPNEADDKYYIRLGRAYNTTNIALHYDHPVFMHDGNGIKQVFPDIAASTFTGNGANLTQLNGSNITSGTVVESRIGELSAAKITSGVFAADRIPSLNANKITSGALSDGLIPGLDTSKITSGTLSSERLPTSGVTAGAYGPAVDLTLLHGDSFNVPLVTIDDRGRVTSAATKAITLPSYATATSSADGLMSSTDKSKLDNLTTIQLSSGINVTEDTDGVIFTYVN